MKNGVDFFTWEGFMWFCVQLARWSVILACIVILVVILYFGIQEMDEVITYPHPGLPVGR